LAAKTSQVLRVFRLPVRRECVGQHDAFGPGFRLRAIRVVAADEVENLVVKDVLAVNLGPDYSVAIAKVGADSAEHLVKAA